MTSGGELTENVELLFECSKPPNVAWTIGDVELSEELNRPFVLRAQLSTTTSGAEPIQLLGQSCKLTMLRGPIHRQVTGIVTQVQEGNTHPTRVSANIVVVPAFEVLRHRVNTRIFQGAPVPAILEELIGKALEPFKRTVDKQLDRTYPAREYCTQYDESDLDFCHRLMEEEGIVYWFDFSDDVEKLVLADAKAKYGTVKGLFGGEESETLVYSEYEGAVGGHEYVRRFELVSKIRPTKVKTRHFDWTHSLNPHEGDSSEGEQADAFPPGALLAPSREVYEHDESPITLHSYDDGTGVYDAQDVADQKKLRRQALAWEAAVADGDSAVLQMRPGALMNLSGHPWPGLDGKYLVFHVHHRFAGGDGAHHGYDNTVRCIPENVAYRPKRVTPKPRVESIETATVVGKGGEEIHTDRHGRVVVQFQWDRKGEKNEKSSCFIRVLQPWAGQGWGHVFIPRMGMEVEVAFVDGDPDRPVVLGAVYNADNQPPYTLPDEKTKSTIKTNSSIGGGGFNELRFEDKKGSEEIFVHAQKDYNEKILNCHTTSVGADQTNTVGRHQKQVVEQKQDEHVKGKQTMTVDLDRDVHVVGKLTETIDTGHHRSVSSGVHETIAGGETRDVTGPVSETIGPSRTQTIDGNSTEKITGSLTQTLTGGATISSPVGYSVTAQQGITLTGIAHNTRTSPTHIEHRADVILNLAGNVQMSVGVVRIQIMAGSFTICPIIDLGGYLNKVRNGLDKTDLYAGKTDVFGYNKKGYGPYKKGTQPFGMCAALLDFYKCKIRRLG